MELEIRRADSICVRFTVFSRFNHIESLDDFRSPLSSSHRTIQLKSQHPPCVRNLRRVFFLLLATMTIHANALAQTPAPEPKGIADDSGTTHGFIAFGEQTYIISDTGEKTWTYPHSTRDGYVLKNGNIILTLSKSKQYPGGAVVEIDKTGKESLIWKGTQAEVNSAQPTTNDTFVITEAGERPRLLELDREGNIQVEFPLVCQEGNHHLQTRMARKIADGTYLVPHLLDFAVLNYNSNGEVLSKIDTAVPGDEKREIHTWPFKAIRDRDGRTLVCGTNGNRVMEFDSSGKVSWQLTNDELPGPWLQDPCGGQVLPNGNIVIACYAGGRKDPKAPKLVEVNRNKKVVWTYSDGQKVGIHHFQILSINGKPLEEPAMK